MTKPQNYRRIKTFALALLISCVTGLISCQKEITTPSVKEAGHISGKANTQNAKFQIGQEYGGGIIVYIDESGRHGLIMAKTDLSGTWGCFGTLIPYSFDGVTMTSNILSACGEPSIAARLCNEYIAYETGASDNYLNERGRKYDDWFMPSGTELNLSGTHFWDYLTKGATYWTTVQATYFVRELNPANYVQTIQPYDYVINGVTYVGTGPGVSAKNNLRAVRPWRRF